MQLKKIIIQGINDLFNGLKMHQIWCYLAIREIKTRYRRSSIGPFWLTLSTAIFILALGPLYGSILKMELSQYLPYLAIGFIVWGFISTSLNDSSGAFIGSESFIKQAPLPFSIYILRVMAKNIIIFFHNLIIILFLLLFFPPKNLDLMWTLPLGFLVLVLNLFWMGLIFAIVSTRFRDIPQIIASILQIAFFITPIMWKVEMLDHYGLVLVKYNPFYHLIELIRAPLFSTSIPVDSWYYCIAMVIIGLLIATVTFSYYRRRIPYWL